LRAPRRMVHWTGTSKDSKSAAGVSGPGADNQSEFMTYYRTLVKGVLNSQVAAVAQTFVSFAVLVVLTRATTVSTFGQYSVVFGLVTIFSSFGGLNVYFYYRNRYPLVAYDGALAILRQYVFFVVFCGMLLAAGTGVLDLLVPNFLPLQSILDYALWAMLAILSLLSIETTRFYQSIGRNAFSIWLATCGKSVSLALFALYPLATGRSVDLRTILVVLVVSQAASIAIQLGLDRPFLRILHTRSPPFEWRAASAGLVLIPAALFYQAISFFDRLSLSSYTSYEISGRYSLAAQGIAIAYAVLGGTIVTLFYPQLVRATEHGPTPETWRLLRFAFLAGTAACLVGAGAIVLFAPLVAIIFGPSYAASVSILQMMCLVPLFMFILSGLSHMTYLFDQLGLSAFAYALGCTETIVLFYILVPLFGVTGAVAAIYVSLLSIALLHGLILARWSALARGEIA
jgi:O-antigen/teichoic acid export membrane protein